MASKKNFIPAKDTLFSNWLNNFGDTASSQYASIGMTLAQVTALTSAITVFMESYSQHLAAQIAAKAASETKDAARKDVEEMVRSLVKIIQAHPGLTDAQREGLGITVPKTTRTPVSIPTSRPVASVEDIEEFTHTLRIRDDVTNKAAKPDGVNGAMLYMKVVAPGAPAPTDPDEMDLVSIPSKNTFVQSFDSADAGKTAYYRLRWVNTKNQPGPWGPQVAATIAA